MSTKRLNPFRKKSSFHEIFAALQRANKPLTCEEISKRAKVNLKRTRTLLAAARNRFHNAPLRRAGYEVELVDSKYRLIIGKPDPKASRPRRGKAR